MSKASMEYKEDVRENTEKYLKYTLMSVIATIVLFSSAVWVGSNVALSLTSVGWNMLVALLVVGTCLSFVIFNSNLSYYGLYKLELNSLERG